jgi:hypothetical protein
MARKEYSLDHIERGLMALIMSGNNSRAAVRLLNTQKISVPESTLRGWKDKYPDLYYELKDKQLPALRKKHEQALEEGLTETYEVYQRAVRYADAQIESGDLKDGATAAKNLAASYRELSNSLRLSRGEPTEIVQSNGDDVLARIQSFMEIIPGTAQEITQPAIPATSSAPESEPKK